MSPLTINVSRNSTPLAFNNFRIITVSNLQAGIFYHFRWDTPCLRSLFYKYDIPSLRNCKGESVLLPGAPQAFFKADGMYHIISRDPNIQLRNDSGAAGFSISTLSCQACFVHPSCKSKLSFNQRDLELVPDIDFFKKEPRTIAGYDRTYPVPWSNFQASPQRQTQISHLFYCWSPAVRSEHRPSWISGTPERQTNVSGDTCWSNSSYCQVLPVYFTSQLDSSVLISPHSTGCPFFYAFCRVVFAHLLY